MSTIEPRIDPSEIRDDLERAIQLALSGERDPEFERRIHAEANRIREEIFRRHGVLDIGVPAIRELRGELPAS